MTVLIDEDIYYIAHLSGFTLLFLQIADSISLI